MIRVLILALFFISQMGLSQTGFITSPQVISNVGGTWIQNNYNLSFTVGEIAIATFPPTIDPYDQSSNGDLILTQGFHQDNYQIVNISESPLSYKISVFPNPTQNQLNISFDIPKNTATIMIRDVKGNIIYIKPDFLTDEDQMVELTSLAQGIYWLEIILEKSERIVYQIQKIN